MLTFEVTDEQRKKIAEWDDPDTGHKCADNVRIERHTNGKAYKYVGPIGGSIVYAFTQTSIGYTVEAICDLCGSKINVTDYSKW